MALPESSCDAGRRRGVRSDLFYFILSYYFLVHRKSRILSETQVLPAYLRVYESVLSAIQSGRGSGVAPNLCE